MYKSDDAPRRPRRPSISMPVELSLGIGTVAMTIRGAETILTADSAQQLGEQLTRLALLARLTESGVQMTPDQMDAAFGSRSDRTG